MAKKEKIERHFGNEVIGENVRKSHGEIFLDAYMDALDEAEEGMLSLESLANESVIGDSKEELKMKPFDFEEWRETVIKFKWNDKPTKKNYQKYLAHELSDKQHHQRLLDLAEKKDWVEFWVEYFKENGSHGELAGAVSAILVVGKRRKDYEKISANFHSGWDS